jgi:ribonuclease-3
MGFNLHIDTNTIKNIDKSHIYGDALEALIGAIYLDRGYKSAKFFVTKRILSQFVDLNEVESNDNNFKSQLIEWSQKNKKEIKFETTEEWSEKTKQPKFHTIIEIDNKEIGKGSGTSKKEAHQNAARQTLEILSEL